MATSTSTILRRLTLLSNRYRHSQPPSFSSSANLSSKEKIKAAIALLKTETNPDRILDICRSAPLSPDSRHGRIAFSLAISNLVASNSFQLIHSLIEELKRRPHLKSERFASHSIILYGQAGMIDNAISTFENLDDLGVDRSVKTLNSLIYACILAKAYPEARRIFVDFPKTYNLNPDLETYNFMIKAFSESGSSISGYSVVVEMERAGCKPNETTFGTLIEGLYKEEKFEDVRKVLKMMEGRRMKPGLEVFNLRIKSLCKLRRSAEARELLDSMLSRGMEANAVSYSHLIHGFCKEGKMEDAKRVFLSMVERGCEPDSSCYFTLMHFLCEVGADYDSALRLCRDCMKKNWVPSFTTMKLLVEGLVSVSKLDEARELIVNVKDRFPNNARLWEEIEVSLLQ